MMQVLCRFTIRIETGGTTKYIRTLLFHTYRCAHHKKELGFRGTFNSHGTFNWWFSIMVRVVALHMNVVVDQTARRVDSFTNQRYLWKKWINKELIREMWSRSSFGNWPLPCQLNMNGVSCRYGLVAINLWVQVRYDLWIILMWESSDFSPLTALWLLLRFFQSPYLHYCPINCNIFFYKILVYEFAR